MLRSISSIQTLAKLARSACSAITPMTGCQIDSRREKSMYLCGGKLANLPRYLWDERHLQELTGGEYTIKPLRVRRLGGRNPETGRKVNQHIGGGVNFDYFMIDFHRRGPSEEGKTYDERVIEVRRDANRSAHIALVAGVQGKRWILATENMEAGQIIKTSQYIPRNPLLEPREGDAYPLGAYRIGEVVCCIETHPSRDCVMFAIHAGGCATVINQIPGYTTLKVASKAEFTIKNICMATVGVIGPINWNQLQFGSANMHRRFGFRPASGYRHKKDGTQGFKNHPPKKLTLDTERKMNRLDNIPKMEKQKFTMTKRQLNSAWGTAATHKLITNAQYRF
ncbi:ribosomal proteins l2, RNA binding domain-containing protein [Ditylenchus destructor]|uniref:Ribosomal proteins l2, RNA binding domain-containing protein n=1 Tax=Ditylenchus destructor TaxID=166010 RepID=A0AAD4R1D8_9BILA|nr:ribosomal proteins l2, RNA binding domain-containing protein [Ditylenchus destructor]